MRMSKKKIHYKIQIRKQKTQEKIVDLIDSNKRCNHVPKNCQLVEVKIGAKERRNTLNQNENKNKPCKVLEDDMTRDDSIDKGTYKEQDDEKLQE